MQTQKMSLANIKGKLSRAEMKNIMAGSGGSGGTCNCNSSSDCNDSTKPTCYNCAAYGGSGPKPGMCDK